MFGISFSELLLVGLVALLVLGPERLPGAARTAGLWIGRLKRSFNTIKQEVEREIGADEIRRQLHNEHILSMEREAQLLAPLTGQNPPQETPPPAAEARRQAYRRRRRPARLRFRPRTPRHRRQSLPPLPLRHRPRRRVIHERR